jgi:hypothetical protein
MGAYRAISTAAALFLAMACTGDSRAASTPLTPTARVPSGVTVPTAIAIVSGNDQQGKAGEQLGEPFVVRAKEANGNGVSDVSVSFQIASGAGTLGGHCAAGAPTAVARTNPDGIATMAFHPTALGRSTVTAGVAGIHDASVTFAVDVTALVIEFWFGYWNVGFIDPCTLSSDVTVPSGTTVEWKVPVEDERYPITYTVTSTSTPPGASGFDSGVLTSRERFRFVPLVTGTWEYRDQITGRTGTLTAR